MIFSRHANSAAVSLLAATSYYFFVSSSSSSSYASQSHVAAGAVVTTITDEEVIDAADAGILALQVPPSSSSSVDQDNTIGTIIGRGLQATTNYCTDGYVDCTAGYVTGDPDQTPCHQACYDNDLPGYRCCGGTKACDLFTGKICKDKYSCMGTEACYDATIPIVVKSCNGGDKACWKVGRIPGCAANKVGNFINSCIGEKSCYQVAYGDRAGSGVGNLINSCTAEEACRDMGRDGKGGIITSDLKDCCTTGRSCFEYGEFNIPDVCKAATGTKSGKTKSKGGKTKKPTASPTASWSPTISTAPAGPKSGKSSYYSGKGGKTKKPTASWSPTISTAPAGPKSGKSSYYPKRTKAVKNTTSMNSTLFA